MHSTNMSEVLVKLEKFGTLIGHLTEETYPDSDSWGDPTGTGTCTIKMKLCSRIPQLLPCGENKSVSTTGGFKSYAQDVIRNEEMG